MNESELPAENVEKTEISSKLEAAGGSQDRTQGKPDYCLGDDRHIGGMNLT